MILLRNVEDTHPPVVCTYIVKRSHPLERVLYRLRLLQTLTMCGQSIVEGTLIALSIAQNSQSDDATEHIPLTLQACLQMGQRVDAPSRPHKTIGSLTLSSSKRDSLSLLAR